jgi:hypothetical protein
MTRFKIALVKTGPCLALICHPSAPRMRRFFGIEAALCDDFCAPPTNARDNAVTEPRFDFLVANRSQLSYTLRMKVRVFRD